MLVSLLLLVLQVVSAPTGAGKTGVMELAMLRLLSKHLTPAATVHKSHQHPQNQPQHQVLQALNGRNKVVYIGPIKALVQERQADWQQRFGTLGLRCVQLTGDVDDDKLEDELDRADIICTTPEKFGEGA
jgi:ATP-dependent DNA helicase HFM1/MER3